MKHGKKYNDSRKAVDSAKQYASKKHCLWFAQMQRLSSMKPSKLTFVWALTPVTLSSRFVVRLYCQTAPAKPFALCVFCKENKYEAAQAAGADYVGGQDLVDKIQGKLDGL